MRSSFLIFALLVIGFVIFVAKVRESREPTAAPAIEGGVAAQ